MPRAPNRYAKIIEQIFQSHYQEGAREVPFEREDIERAASTLGVKLPKNLGDVIYSFRYRVDLPEWIQSKAPTGEGWIIRPAGKARYRFVASTTLTIIPNTMLAETKVPDATPGIIVWFGAGETAVVGRILNLLAPVGPP